MIWFVFDRNIQIMYWLLPLLRLHCVVVVQEANIIYYKHWFLVLGRMEGNGSWWPWHFLSCHLTPNKKKSLTRRLIDVIFDLNVNLTLSKCVYGLSHNSNSRIQHKYGATCRFESGAYIHTGIHIFFYIKSRRYRIDK